MMLMLMMVLMLAVAVVKGPMRYPQYQIRLHDVWRLSPAAHQSDKGQLLLSVHQSVHQPGRHKIPLDTDQSGPG